MSIVCATECNHCNIVCCKRNLHYAISIITCKECKWENLHFTLVCFLCGERVNCKYVKDAIYWTHGHHLIWLILIIMLLQHFNEWFIVINCIILKSMANERTWFFVVLHAWAVPQKADVHVTSWMWKNAEVFVVLLIFLDLRAAYWRIYQCLIYYHKTTIVCSVVAYLMGISIRWHLIWRNALKSNGHTPSDCRLLKRDKKTPQTWANSL